MIPPITKPDCSLFWTVELRLGEEHSATISAETMRITPQGAIVFFDRLETGEELIHAAYAHGTWTAVTGG